MNANNTPWATHTVYYDGDCPLCSSEMAFLMRANRDGRLGFVDISRPGFDAQALGVTREALMALLHVRDATGQWLIGVPAVQAVYAATGHRRLAAALDHPVIARLARPAYAWLARNRYHLPRWLLAATHLHTSRCAPDGACRIHPER
jgi:predicted DCC family thiol-disulfide oxidoreductase YuxK